MSEKLSFKTLTKRFKLKLIKISKILINTVLSFMKWDKEINSKNSWQFDALDKAKN